MSAAQQPVTTDASAEMFRRAHRVTPGGVNSPVRAFNAVGGTPRFIRSAQGAWLHDVDGNSYVDLICSWGPMLLGHAHPEVVAAIQEQVEHGTTFFASNEFAILRPLEFYIGATSLHSKLSIRTREESSTFRIG